MTMEPSTLMIMVWHSVCVCVSARRVEEPIWCVNVEISHSPLFSLLLESLCFSVFIIFSFVPLLPMLLWPVHLSLGLLALLKYQISTWLTRSLCRKTWWRRNFFHIFNIFLSLVAFSKAWKSSPNLLRGCSWLLNRAVCVRVCVCTQTTYRLAYQEGRSSRVARKKGE